MSQATFVYVTYIKSTQQKVWDAITKTELSRQYWAGNQNASDWKVGSKWEHQNTRDNNKQLVVGEVVEFMPTSHMVWTWARPGTENDPSQVSRVTFDLEQAGELVKLTVVHSELEEGGGMQKGISEGWPLVLASLKSWIETGKPIDIPAYKEQLKAKASA